MGGQTIAIVVVNVDFFVLRSWRMLYLSGLHVNKKIDFYFGVRNRSHSEVWMNNYRMVAAFMLDTNLLRLVNISCG